MNVESFERGDTVFHRRDTRVKLLAAFPLSLVLALTSSFSTAIAGCLIGAALLLFSRPDPKLFFKRLVLVNIFSLFLFATLPLTYSGDGGNGLTLAMLICIKTNGIFFCFLALIATSNGAKIGYALDSLGLPTKLSFLFLFSYRQLFIIKQEYDRLQRAARLRGFIPSNSLHTYRTYSHLFGMTLVKSWNRAERIHQAMLLRGFSGKLIPLTQQSPTSTDYLFLTVLHLLTLLLIGTSFCPLLP